MNIKLFVTQAGRILLTCDQYIKKPIERLIFNFEKRELFLKLEGEDKPFKLNCHVDDYIARFMAYRKTCGIGFMTDGKLKSAVYVDLETNINGNQ
jgi:hypothetical protein